MSLVDVASTIDKVQRRAQNSICTVAIDEYRVPVKYLSFTGKARREWKFECEEARRNESENDVEASTIAVIRVLTHR